MFGPAFESGAACREPPVGDAIAAPSVPTLIAALGLRACWYEPFPFDVQLPRIEPGRIVLPPDEPGIAPAPAGAAVELPVRHSGLTLGRFVLVPASPTCGVGFTAASRDEVIALAASVGELIATAFVMGRVPSF